MTRKPRATEAPPLFETTVARTWDGDQARPDEIARVGAWVDGAGLRVCVDAPFHGDAAPAAPPGRVMRLWEHEVVEVFLVGRGADYIEIELGPWGHFLVLRLDGPRRVVRDDIEAVWTVERRDGRWRGEARIDAGHLPAGLTRWNAFAIHGSVEARRYLAAHPLPGPAPDFHRIDAFPRFEPLDPDSTGS